MSLGNLPDFLLNFSGREMSRETNHSYRFKSFRLDVEDRQLIHDGVPVQLEPKVFDVLALLVENNGHLVEKDELLRSVWADSFVEETNVARAVYTLRKTLGDDGNGNKFIETVAKKGYRFVAKVTEVPFGDGETERRRDGEKVSEESPRRRGYRFNGELKHKTELEPQPKETAKLLKFPMATGDQAVAEKAGAVNFSIKKRTGFAIGIAALLIGAIALGGWFAAGKRTTNEISVLSAPFAVEKLSSNGKVFHAVISPDGKNVAYTNKGANESASIWLRQIENGNNFEIISPGSYIYFGLQFSPDGYSLYFARCPRNVELADIYRISIFGGVPQKIVSDTQGWMSLSPDGSRLSFVRCPRRDDEYCSLWIADSADGRNEKKLAVRPRPFRIGDNKFSPDGKSVAFAVGQSENSANDFGLSAVDVESGAEKELTTEKFFNIGGVAWLPDQKSLLITASRNLDKKIGRIWQISAETGKAEPLTDDSETYSSLSLDRTASHLISIRIKENFSLRVTDFENALGGSVLAEATSAAFAPDGKIFYTSTMAGNDEIWSMNADGGGQKQLTNNATLDKNPVVAPDGGAVYFGSNRSGAIHVWRMNADGSNQMQITRENGGTPLFASPDGEWLYYHHGTDRTLWRVSTRSGEERLVLNKRKFRFAFSSDGAQAAYGEKIGGEDFIVIVSLADGQTLKTFKYAEPKTKLFEIAFLPEAKGLIYILAGNEFRQNTLWQQPFDTTTEPQKIAELGEEQISEGGGFALSPDGKRFAVTQGRWLHDAVLLKGLK